jgi:hypothetical protein
LLEKKNIVSSFSHFFLAGDAGKPETKASGDMVIIKSKVEGQEGAMVSFPPPEFGELSPASEEAIEVLCSQAEASVVQGKRMNDQTSVMNLGLAQC